MIIVRRLARLGPVTSMMAAALLACGGGGGEAEAPRFSDATLSGTYRFSFLTSESSVNSEQGSASFDGRGAWSASSNPDPSSGTYRIASDGTLSLTDGQGWLEGAVSADGTMAFASAVSWGSSPTMTLLLKNGEGFSNASLSGTYFVAGFGTDGQTKAFCLTGTMMFDGAGTVAAALSVNKGNEVPSSESATGTYSVTSSGSIQVSLRELQLAGTLGSRGDLAVLSFAYGNETGWFVAVRKGGSLTGSDITGAYRVVSFAQDAMVRGISSIGTLDILPSGEARHQAKYNRGGSIVPSATSGNHTVQPDGTFVVALDDGLLLRGGLLADGSVAVAANMNPQAPPTVVIALRQ